MIVERGAFAPVRARMVEKRGQCSYEVGKEFIWKDYQGPAMCLGLKTALREWVVLCSLGARSWEKDPAQWYISCPSKKGTVWLLEAAGEGAHWMAE